MFRPRCAPLLSMQLLLALLVALASVSAPLRSHAQDASLSTPQPSPPPQRMRVVLDANGLATVVPEDELARASAGLASAFADVILPAASGDGLVPLWMVEKERKAREEEDERQQKAEQDALAAKRQAAEEEARANAAAAIAEAQQRAEEQLRQQTEQRYRDEQQRRAEEQQREQEAEQQRQQQTQEAEAETERVRRAQELADEVAAAAARHFAEQGLVAADSPGQVAFVDPSQSLLGKLSRAAFFRELTPSNAWAMVTQGRPFLMLVVCACHRDADLDIEGLENIAHDKGLHHRFSFLWVRQPTADRFAIAQTYALQPDQLALAIDNIPIGQQVEKYVYAPGVDRESHLRGEATARDMIGFAEAFFLAPTPLSLVRRSQPVPQPPFDVDKDRGKVVEVVGDSFSEIVLESAHTVLLMLYMPGCAGCISAHPILEKVAESLAWTNRDVIVARMDRTQNDPPQVIRFQTYPALLLWKAGMKSYDTSFDGGEEPSKRGLLGSRGWRAPEMFNAEKGPDQCPPPLSVESVEAFVRQHTGGGNLLGDGGMGMRSSQAQSAPEPETSAPHSTDADTSHAQSTQEAGTAM